MHLHRERARINNKHVVTMAMVCIVSGGPTGL